MPCRVQGKSRAPQIPRETIERCPGLPAARRHDDGVAGPHGVRVAHAAELRGAGHHGPLPPRRLQRRHRALPGDLGGARGLQGAARRRLRHGRRRHRRRQGAAGPGRRRARRPRRAADVPDEGGRAAAARRLRQVPRQVLQHRRQRRRRRRQLLHLLLQQPAVRRCAGNDRRRGRVRRNPSSSVEYKSTRSMFGRLGGSRRVLGGQRHGRVDIVRIRAH